MALQHVRVPPQPHARHSHATTPPHEVQRRLQEHTVRQRALANCTQLNTCYGNKAGHLTAARVSLLPDQGDPDGSSDQLQQLRRCRGK